MKELRSIGLVRRRYPSWILAVSKHPSGVVETVRTHDYGQTLVDTNEANARTCDLPRPRTRRSQRGRPSPPWRSATK